MKKSLMLGDQHFRVNRDSLYGTGDHAINVASPSIM